MQMSQLGLFNNSLASLYEELFQCVQKNGYNLRVEMRKYSVDLMGEFFRASYTPMLDKDEQLKVMVDLPLFLSKISKRHHGIENSELKNFQYDEIHSLANLSGEGIDFGDTTHVSLIRRDKDIKTMITDDGENLVFSGDHVSDILWFRSYTSRRFIGTRYPEILRVIGGGEDDEPI